jgi:hypothetical protein
LGNQQGSSVYCGNRTDSNKSDAINYWVAGFIEGEGSFNVAFKLRPDLRMGFDISPEISVTQLDTGLDVLKLVKKTLKNIGSDLKLKEKNSQVLVYKITNLNELVDTAIPFLLKYNVFSARKAELNVVKSVCQMKKQKLHLTVSGMTKIIDLVFSVTLKKTNRQFSKEVLLSVLGQPKKVAELVNSRHNAKNNKIGKVYHNPSETTRLDTTKSGI